MPAWPPPRAAFTRAAVSGLPDVFAGDMRPLRFLGATDGNARVDLNHRWRRTLYIEGASCRRLV
jgi:hypothetical protein